MFSRRLTSINSTSLSTDTDRELVFFPVILLSATVHNRSSLTRKRAIIHTFARRITTSGSLPDARVSLHRVPMRIVWTHCMKYFIEVPS